MDHSSFYRKRSPQCVGLRSALSPAIASLFLLTGYASCLGNEHRTWQDGAAEWQAAGANAAPKSRRLPATPKVLVKTPRPTRVSAPVVDISPLVGRFAGLQNDGNNPAPVIAGDQTRLAPHPLFNTLAASGDDVTKHRRAAYSSIGVFSFGQTQAETEPEPDRGKPRPSHILAPRGDLLDGVPEAYASLVVRIAAEEAVDPNWVLAVMRAENAGFDRRLASPAGAIGLMQVMPQIGAAFGASDLTDPEQNIRAGTRFLHLLIGKYRNPVLIASAYNAGEPRVDANHSLPLIQETADYVTRVVGYYTGMTAVLPAAHAAVRPRAGISQVARRGRAARAKSPMLVFSVAEPSAALGPARQQPDLVVSGGPVKLVKEEAVQ